MNRRSATSPFLAAGAVLAVLGLMACTAPPSPTVWTASTLAGSAGVSGSANGVGSAARFSYPHGLAVADSGDSIVADQQNNTIRRVRADGTVTTIAGTAGATGSADGVGATARFNVPTGVAIGPSGNIYVADAVNCTIRKIAPDGTVTTLAGRAGAPGSADGTASAARFNKPDALAVDSDENLYVADTYNSTIRRITPTGAVTTLAGSPGVPGTDDGVGSNARFSLPRGIAVDANGTVFVADTYNSTIRRIEPDGSTSTIAGAAGLAGSADGPAADARFNQPFGIVSRGSDLFVADTFNHTVRRITALGRVTTIAGAPGASGALDGLGNSARFDRPYAITVDGAGRLLVSDTYNHTVRLLATS